VGALWARTRGGVGLACRKRDAHDAAVTCEPPAYRVGALYVYSCVLLQLAVTFGLSRHGVKTRLIGEVDPTLKPILFRPPVNMPRRDVYGTRGKRRHGACGGRATSGNAHTRQNIASAEASTSELCVWRASAPVTPSSGVRYQHTYQSWGSTPVQRSADRRTVERIERTTTVQYSSRAYTGQAVPREDDGARDARQGASGRHAEGESPKRDVNQPPSKPEASVLCVRRSAARAPRGLLAKPAAISMSGMQTRNARKV
jgi:hypothetical protein